MFSQSCPQPIFSAFRGKFSQDPSPGEKKEGSTKERRWESLSKSENPLFPNLPEPSLRFPALSTDFVQKEEKMRFESNSRKTWEFPSRQGRLTSLHVDRH